MVIKMSKNTIIIEGHAEYGKHGSDIVCSAVSAIFQTAQIGLAQIATQYPDYIKLESTDKKFTHTC